MVIADQALEIASRDGLGIVMSCVPTDQIYFLTLFFMYGLLSTKFLMFVAPLLVFYIAFATIVITTLQMFYKKKKLKEASALAEVLKQYDVGVDVNQTQSQYSWNSLTPYIVYFCAIPMVVVSFSLADKNYIPCSEISVLCLIFCGICFLAISDSHDLVTLLALFCGFLAALPVIFEKIPEIPVITSLIHLVSGSITTIELFGGFRLNIGIPAICYLIIPCFFIQMAARNSFEGMYRVLVPHLVCYFWFNLATTMYPFTTWFGLARATVGYIMMPLLVPLSLFFFAIGMIYMFIKLASSDLFGKIVITLLLGCIPILLTQTKKLLGGKLDENKKFVYLKKGLMGLFAIMAIVPLVFVRLPSISDKVVVDLSLSEYMSLCHPGDGANTADRQIKCAQLAGTKITWKGVFMSAKVVGISNDVSQMIDVFPTFIGNPLKCFYGKSYGDCDDEGMSESDIKYCQLMTSLGRECHMKEHDKYSFNFAVSVTENDKSLTLSIDAGHAFRETLVALEPSDEVEVKANLVDGLGTVGPKLRLKEVTCTSRDLAVMRMIQEEKEDWYYELFDQSLKVAFNFFWYPLMEYVPQMGAVEAPVSEE